MSLLYTVWRSMLRMAWQDDAGYGLAVCFPFGVVFRTPTLQVNRRFLIGQSVDSETIEGIKTILMSRGSIEQLHQVGRSLAA